MYFCGFTVCLSCLDSKIGFDLTASNTWRPRSPSPRFVEVMVYVQWVSSRPIELVELQGSRGSRWRGDWLPPARSWSRVGSWGSPWPCGLPQNGWFISWTILLKWMIWIDLGVPLFSETSSYFVDTVYNALFFAAKMISSCHMRFTELCDRAIPFCFLLMQVHMSIGWCWTFIKV